MKRQISLLGLTTSIVRTSVTCALLICALLMTLAAYGATKPISKFEVLRIRTGSKEMPGRQFECTKKDANGECLANKCTQGPGGYTYDCESFAISCIKAGLHWSGTYEGGTCRKVL